MTIRVTTPTAPLREEHAELLPHLETLRTAADLVGDAPDEVLLARVDAAHAFLRDDLIVHATAEDVALYPVVEQALGARATATMSRDHVEVGRLTGELAAARARLAAKGLSPELGQELRRLLYGLYAVVVLHFAKEEEVYLPVLDETLSAEAAADLFAAMGHAAEAARP